MNSRLSGLWAACVFCTMTIACAAIRPGYDHTTQLISELGETGGSHAWLFNYGGFLPAGILIVGFAFYLRYWLLQQQLRPLAATLLAIHGIGMALATWFSCDTGCNPAQPSSSQIAHNLLAAIKFPALIAATFVLGWQLRRLPEQRRLAWFSFAAGSIGLMFMLAFMATAESRDGTGVYQRVFIGVLYGWLAAISYVVSKDCRTTRQPVAG